MARVNYLRFVSLSLNPRLTDDEDVNEVVEVVIDVAEHFQR